MLPYNRVIQQDKVSRKGANEMATVALDTLIKRNEAITATDIDGDKVMMDLDQGKYFALNEVSGRIWDLLAQAHTPEWLIDQLLQEYEVTPEACEAEVLKHLELLKGYNLIQ